MIIYTRNESKSEHEESKNNKAKGLKVYTVRFEAEVRNGAIYIPKEYKELESKHLEVVLLVKSDEPQNQKKAFEVSDDYVQNHWQEIAYKASGDVFVDDDEKLHDAYLKYTNDKNSL